MPSQKSRDPVRVQLESLRRSQILDAAAQTFAKRGFRVARMQDVAQTAGVSHGTVYNYFDGKDALLLALLDRLNESDRRPTQLGALRADDLRGTFSALMRHRFELMQENRDLWRALLPELLSDQKLRRRYLQRIVRPTLALAEEAFFGLGVEQPAVLVRGVSASLMGLVLMELLEEPTTLQEASRVLDLLIHALADQVERSTGARPQP